MGNTINFGGLTIVVENPAGSVRRGIDNEGTPWQTQMTYDYGELKGTLGVDGDPIDVFVNQRGPRKWVYIVYTTTKDGSGFDEQKCFLGFEDTMDAKNAFFKNYDLPDQFFGRIEAIPFADFKKKVLATKNNPSLIHASKIEAAIQLYAKDYTYGSNFKVGEEVYVDGLRGRGVVMEVDDHGRLKIRYRSGLWITRAPNFVHHMNEGEYKNKYMTSNVRQGLG